MEGLSEDLVSASRRTKVMRSNFDLGDTTVTSVASVFTDGLSEDLL